MANTDSIIHIFIGIPKPFRLGGLRLCAHGNVFASFSIVFYCLEVKWNSLGIVEQNKAMQKRYRVHVALVLSRILSLSTQFFYCYYTPGYTFMSRKIQSQKYLIGHSNENDGFDWLFNLVIIT